VIRVCGGFGEAILRGVVLQRGQLLLRIRHMAFEPGDAKRCVTKDSQRDRHKHKRN